MTGRAWGVLRWGATEDSHAVSRMPDCTGEQVAATRQQDTQSHLFSLQFSLSPQFDIELGPALVTSAASIGFGELPDASATP
jgi:hypothetical protein